MTPFFRCAECGECAYCGGDVEIIDGEAQMIDIESMDRDALIAEIRRLRGENKMLYQMVDDAIAMAAHRRTGLLGPDRVEHRKCQKCTGTAIVDGAVGDRWYWAQCQRCGLLGLMRRTEAEAWAAWDGVE